MALGPCAQWNMELLLEVQELLSETLEAALTAPQEPARKKNPGEGHRNVLGRRNRKRKLGVKRANQQVTSSKQNKERRTVTTYRRALNKEQRTKNKEQMTKNKEQITNNEEPRTKQKQQL